MIGVSDGAFYRTLLLRKGGGEKVRDYISIGSSPADEDCAQLGSEDYYERAKEECKRFIDLIREVCGQEPEGARLKIKSNPHDFGTYYDVVVEFDDMIEDAVNYAFHVEGNSPLTWEEEEGSRKFIPRQNSEK